MITRRRDELESRVATLEADYEELLGMFLSDPYPFCAVNNISRHIEKTIHEEETSNIDIAESMADLKVRALILCLLEWIFTLLHHVTEQT